MTQLSGLTLAYLGDAYYELQIRSYLINKGITNVNTLHQKAIRFTSAKGQASIIDYLLENLSSEEISVFKRGRNATSTHKPKNADLSTYQKATGFETLIGFLYVEKEEDRLKEIIDLSIQYIEELQA